MSGNPNNQKLGKRKSTAKQPGWLFPASSKPVADVFTSTSQSQERTQNTNDKQLAKDLLKRRAAGEPAKSSPPPQLLELVGAFLNEYEFTSASQALKAERENRGDKASKVKDMPSLSTVFSEWSNSKGDYKATIQSSSKYSASKKAKVEKAKKQESSSSESSSSDEDSDVEMADVPSTKKASFKRSSSSSSSSSTSSSDSDADDEKETPVVKPGSPKAKIHSLKRKAESSSESSSSESDSSSDDEAPKSKKVKTAATSSSDSSSGSSSDSSSDTSSNSSSDSSTDKVVRTQKAKTIKKTSDSGSSSSSSSDSDSSSSSDSDSDYDSHTKSIAQKTPLPDSDSDSSSSESDSSDSDSAKNTKGKKTVASSDTSATLSDGPKKSAASSSSDSSSDSSSSDSGDDVRTITKTVTTTTKDSEGESKVVKVTQTVTTSRAHELDPPLPPDPVLKRKKTNEPFSRIPKDIKVDERLASNAYVPYDYAQKAHEDLIVTRGKGFTKEKNKKKRGSYRGGYIDVEGKKGIKFTD